MEPANRLEQTEDGEALWRGYINRQLAAIYGPLFSLLDPWVLLQPPDWESVRRWQLTAALEPGWTPPEASAVEPTPDVSPYQRVTEAMLRHGPENADVTLGLNQTGQFDSLFLRDGQ